MKSDPNIQRVLIVRAKEFLHVLRDLALLNAQSVVQVDLPEIVLVADYLLLENGCEARLNLMERRLRDDELLVKKPPLQKVEELLPFRLDLLIPELGDVADEVL